MLVMVNLIKGIAHAVTIVNAALSSYFLWINLGKNNLELPKRGIFFVYLFGLLFLKFLLLLRLLLWNMFAICEKKLIFCFLKSMYIW